MDAKLAELIRLANNEHVELMAAARSPVAHHDGGNAWKALVEYLYAPKRPPAPKVPIDRRYLGDLKEASRAWDKKTLRREYRTLCDRVEQVARQISGQTPSQELIDQSGAWRDYGARKALEVRKLRQQLQDRDELLARFNLLDTPGPAITPLPIVPPGGRGGID